MRIKWSHNNNSLFLKYLLNIFKVLGIGKFQILLFFLGSNTILLSQISKDQFINNQFSYQNINVNDGLSQNSVISIVQDSIGYLWFATQDGLNRYDGRNFKYYNKQFEDVTRPHYSRLGKLITDLENNFWIISLTGQVEKYNSKSDSFKPVKKFKDASNLYQDSQLNIYVSTFTNGLFKIDRHSRDTIQLMTEYKDNTFYEITELNHHIYVAGELGVYKFPIASNFASKVYSDSLHFNCFSYSKNNRLFVGTYGNGLFYLDEEEDTFLPFTELGDKKIPTDLNIQDLHFDNNGRLWIATYGHGVYLLDLEKEKVERFVSNKYNLQSISYNDVLCLYEDYNGTIWLGTDGGGVSFYDEHLFKFNVLTDRQVPQDIKVNVIRSITKDKEGILWLGTSGEGLTRVNLKNDTYKTYTSENSDLLSDRIMSLAYIKDELWIGHQGQGLQIMFKNGEFQNYNANTIPVLPVSTIWNIYEDSQDRVWLGTRNNGILQFDPSQGIQRHYTSSNRLNSLVNNNIRAIIEGESDILYAGSDDGGISRINLKNNEISSIHKIINKIKSLHYDDGHTLWIGTNGDGLISYNVKSDSLKYYTTQNGLANNVIYGILSDDDENLWLSSNRGLSKLNTRNFEVTNYTNYDGLQASEFNTGAYYKSEDNTFYFGGLEGLNWFKSGQISLNTSKPKTVISKFEVFEDEKDLGHNYKLNYKDNTVTFTFASLHFSQPERNLYQYKLENHDQQWNNSINNNSAHYTNLPPGDYIFKVKSSNYDGVWNETPATLNFTINQPWYYSLVAFCIYFLILAIGIYFIYDYFKWKWNMKMQLQLEQAETERLKNLDEFKTKLYTNISHEFRTPLTLISGPIERQLNKPNLSNEDKEDLSMVHRNSDRLLTLVNQLLDLSKLESGSLRLNARKGNLGMLLKQLALAFEYKAEEKNIQFVYQPIMLDNVWYDADVIEKIVSNLLHNAIKYTPIDGRINFNTQEKDGQIILTIINSGNTIKDEEIPKLFRRYYQKNKVSDGVGIGLALVKELTILSHGNIIANIINHDDIQFTVTLPIERSYFNGSEIIDEENIIIDSTVTNVIPNTEDSIVTLNKVTPSLLIIEDDKDIRDFIVSIFTDSYLIIEAINGKQGIDKALKKIPDLIICDIMMPVKSGIEVCNTLKYDDRTSHIPIILLTAKIGEANEIIGLKTGADAYITKPFNSEKLKVRVEKLIQLRSHLQQRYQQEFDFEIKAGLNASIEQQFIKRLYKILEQHLTEPDFKSQTFSDKMMMSRMQLHRKLKALTGLTTSEFLISQRIKLASKLIKESDLSISEIAYQVGFNSPSYFSSCFKDIYNCTPIEYQEID